MSAVHQATLSVSQNFLKDPRLVASLVRRCGIEPEDVVYEIGPGKGIITAELAACCKRVTAIEKDPLLAAALRRQFAHQANLTVLTGDFFHHPLPRTPYKVVANIPFNHTSAIIARLTGAANPPEDACLVMQKEAAQMYLGHPRESLRSMLLKPWFEMEILHHFRRADFSPQPGVETVLTRIAKRRRPLVSRANAQPFRDLVVYVFTAWRPTLGEIFKDIFSYRQILHIHRALRIDPQATPSMLRLEHWLCLFETYQAIASPLALSRVSSSEARLKRQQEKLHKIHRTRGPTQP